MPKKSSEVIGKTSRKGVIHAGGESDFFLNFEEIIFNRGFCCLNVKPYNDGQIYGPLI